MRSTSGCNTSHAGNVVHSTCVGGTTTTANNKENGTDTNNKKHRRSTEMQAGFVIVGLFVTVGLLLGNLLLHHQHRTVILHVMRNPWAHGRAALRMAATRKRPTTAGFHHHFYSGAPRFVTVVMPSVVNPDRRKERLEAIHDTWGPIARAIYVLHDLDEFPKASYLTIGEDSRPYDQYSFPQNLLLPSDVNLDDGVQRLVYTISSIYNRVNPDFAFFVNDHTYVIPNHLCYFLENLKSDHDLYAGHALKNGKVIFNSGAAGYILSRETMRKLIQKFDEKDPKCWIKDDAPNKAWLQGNPGLVTNECLSSMGISPVDTRAKHKYHRFHAFPLTRIVSGSVDDWYTKKHQFEELSVELTRGFDASYSTLLSGEDCCSNDSISFHYVESNECKALFAVQNRLLEKPQTIDADLKDFMIQVWPTDRKEIGFYSHGLPESTNEVLWSPLLKTIRKMSVKKTQRDC